MNKIAVIGVNVELPLAKNANEFWDNLSTDKICTSDFPLSRRCDAAHIAEVMDNTECKYIKGTYLDHISHFDYSFFNMSPKESSLMDPNQRKLLENILGLIEDAGYPASKIRKRNIGVFIGARSEPTHAGYGELIHRMFPEDTSISYSGNLQSALAGRISYTFDLTGPSLVIDTACSSSLVALHYAMQELENKNCEMAIVGSVRLNMFPSSNGVDIGIDSPDGVTRTFDEDAAGAGFGEGVVSVMLKPLEQAEIDRDNIYAVILSSAVNQDGKSIGLTAPNPRAQEDVMIRAWEKACINPESITYLECHGTATKLGDPAEINGIKKAFSHYTDKKQFCAVGSVKTHLGHLDNAAGLTGLIKCILSLKHKMIPGNLNFQKPNRKIQFIDSPLYVSSETQAWLLSNGIRRCGISSFGLTGTNCHIVMEEYRQKKIELEQDLKYNKFIVSAKSEEVLCTLLQNYIIFDFKESSIQDIYYTAVFCRDIHPYSVEFSFSTIQKLRESCEDAIICIKQHHQEYKGVIYSCNTAKAGTKSTPIAECNAKLNRGGTESQILKHGNKISIPLYPFAKTACWYDYSIKTDNFYRIFWKKQSHMELQKVHSDQSILILYMEQDSIHNELNEVLSQELNSIIAVSVGTSSLIVHDSGYEMNKKPSGFISLFQYLSKRNISYQRILIIYGNEKKQKRSFVEQQEDIFDLLDIVMAINGHFLHETIYLDIIGSHIHLVQEEEIPINIDKAILFGLIGTISAEYPHIHCRGIDRDIHSSNNLLAQIVVSETIQRVALRNEELYYPELNQVENPDIYDLTEIVRESGTYIVIGGAGGIGIELAIALAKCTHVNIILISRSEFPPRELWDKCIESKNKYCKKIEKIRSIERSGSMVSFLMADVSDEISIGQAFSKVTNQYGQINGIIHAAGVGNGGLLAEQNKLSFSSVLKAKIIGTANMGHLMDNNTDFLLLCSSASTLTGGRGAGAYVVANTYQEAYANVMRKGGKRVICLNWTTWRDTGFAAGKQIESEQDLFKTILPDDAQMSFLTALRKDFTQVYVGKINSESKIYLASDLLPFTISSQLLGVEKSIGNESSSQYERSKSNHQNRETALVDVNLVQKLWCETLGYETIDMESDFFDIGGDSILAVKLQTKLEGHGISIGVNEIKKNSTIKSMYALISNTSSSFREKRILPFNRFFYKSCFYNALFAILELWNVNISGIISNSISYLDVDSKNLTLELNMIEKEEEENIIMGQGIIYRKMDVPHDMLIEQLTHSIREGALVIIWIDAFYSPHRADTYQKEHFAHTLLIYGEEADKRKFHVLDHTNKHSLNYDYREISYDVLLDDYRGYERNFPDSGNYTYHEFINSQSGSLFQTKNFIGDHIRLLDEYKGNILFGLQRIYENPDLLYSQTSLEALISFVDIKRAENYIIMNHKSSRGFEELSTRCLEKWEELKLSLAKYLFVKSSTAQKNVKTLLAEAIQLEMEYIEKI